MNHGGDKIVIKLASNTKSILYPIFFFMISFNLLSFTTYSSLIPGLYALKYLMFFGFIGFMMYTVKKQLYKLSLNYVLVLVLLTMGMTPSLFNVNVGVGTSVVLIANAFVLGFSSLMIFGSIDKKVYVKLIKIILFVVVVSTVIPLFLLRSNSASYYIIGERYRFLGYFNNANELARFLALGFILSLRIFPLAKRLIERFVLFTVMATSVYLITLTDSRAALILCALVSLLVVAKSIFNKIGWNFFIVLILAICIIMVAFLPYVLENFIGQVDINALSSGRIEIWHNLITDKTPMELLFGSGAGRTSLQATAVLTNGYFELLTHFGLTGLVIWISIIVYLLIRKIKEHKEITVGTIVVIGFLVYYLVEGGLVSAGNIASIYFWLELSQTDF